MPLIHSASKKAFKKNIETEMKANPSKDKRKQNIAIAYDIQRRSKGKKKMAKGGFLEERESLPPKSAVDEFYDKMLREEMEERDEAAYADGGFVKDEHELPSKKDISPFYDKTMREHGEEMKSLMPSNDIMNEEMDEDLPLHEQIRRSLKAKAYAEGGEVDLSLDLSEEPKEFYKRNSELKDEKPYIGEDLEDIEQPEDSNEHGDEREDEKENIHDEDMVDSIRRKMRMKRR